MASNPLSREVVMKMSKADLENVCFEKNLPADGTIKELREQLLSEDFKDLQETDDADGNLDNAFASDTVSENDKEGNTEAKSQMFHGEGIAKSSEQTMSMLLQFMMRQEQQRADEHRREQENRRQEEQRRQKEEDNRRQEEQRRQKEEDRRQKEEENRRQEEAKRWQFMMTMMEENRKSDKVASRSHLADHETITRAVDRWESDLTILIDQIHGSMRDQRSTQILENLAGKLKPFEEKLSKILDDNIDHLVKNEKTDELIQRITKIRQDITIVLGEVLEHVEDIKRTELAKSRQGPLPAGTEIPKFDGNVLHFRQWWEHFKSLIHDNPTVAKFWKMRYLLTAVHGNASSVLAGMKGVEEEYADAIELVTRKFGKEHSIVRQLVNAITSTSTPSKEASSFGNFVDDVKSHLAALESHKVTRDMVVMPLIENRLPTSTRMEWEKQVCSIVDGGKQPTTKELVKFLEVEHESLCAQSLVQEEKGNRNSDTKGSSSKDKISSAHSLVTTQEQEDTPRLRKCFDCEGDHMVVDCQSFKTKTKEGRRKLALEKRLCFKCLKFSYAPWHRCRGTECAGCHRFHHELLSCQPSEPVEQTTNLSVITNEGTEVLPTVLAKARSGNKSVVVRLGLDSMSQKTFVTSSTAEKLGLKSVGKKVLTVQGFGGVSSKEVTDIVEFDLLPLDTEEHPISIDAYVKRGQVCAPLGAVTVKKDEFPHLQNLQLSDPHVPEGGEIDILIGQAPLQLIVEDHIVRPVGDRRQPSAWKTRFGYALMGPLPGESSEECSSLCATIHAAPSLDSKLERFWEIETLGIRDQEHILSDQEQSAVKAFNDEMKYEGDRYSVPLPFRDDAPRLESNYAKVFSQLRSLERRLLKNPELKASYQKAMDEYEMKGFSRELTPTERQTFDKDEQYFIPHHAVLKESSVSTKCRVVFNASDTDRNGNSLNSCLLPGPALQPDLGGILLRFRTNRIALTGDIEKMFSQTKVLSAYHKFQQYLWRDCDVSAEPRRMVMTRLMFGVSASPFCAINATHHHAENEEQVKDFPDICQKVKTSLYVDDWQSGAESEEEVVQQYNDAVTFFKTGGWKLTKFASNSSTVLKSIPPSDVHPHATVDLDDRKESHGDTPTALGLRWNTQNDCLYVNVPVRLIDSHTPITKRTVLSVLSSVYDVFGFLSAFMITVKIIMQELWRMKVRWDEELPQHLENAFLKWKSELVDLQTHPFPRYMFKNRKNKKVSLHGFCDASEKAYGAIIYVRYEDESDNVQTAFMISKTKVAPVKTQTIARLELMAALVLAGLMHYVSEQCSMPGANMEVCDVNLWSDSEIVLAWVAKPSSTWKVFVRNRVEQIQQLTDAATWRHCPGRDNPADLISRGRKLKDLIENEFYWNGPSWLRGEESDWPSRVLCQIDIQDLEEDDKDKPAIALPVRTKEPDSPPEFVLRSSRYLKTKRICAWVLRFVHNISGAGKAGELTSAELAEAEMLLFLDQQMRHFKAERTALLSGRDLPMNSPLLGYDPFIDENTALLRIGGRLQQSNLPDMTCHPIILPAKDALTAQVVDYLHCQGQHAAIETTLSLVRQRYHIIHAREVVRSVVRNCLVCRRYNSKPVSQKMGPLPSHRVIPAPAFSDVGLDFTGVLHIKEGDTVHKGYILVFTCPHSRMIHMELTKDMSTEEFLQALRRFMNRRGWCHSIESDNQTTFKKAKKVLEMAFAGRLWDKLNKEEIDRFMSTNGISWRFITERSPFRGAYWERLNRSLKEPLRKVLGNALLTYTELYTLLTDIEATLNQRPLTYHGTDPQDPMPITPSQLAIGRNLKEIPPLQGNGNVTVAERYRYLQKLLKHFWNRWSTEYLPQLQRRTKWTREEEPLKVDDVVLVTEDNTARPTWPLGRVTDVFPGRDGLVRTVKVKTKKGALVRPVQRLHLLERSAVLPVDILDPIDNKQDNEDIQEEVADDMLIVADQGGQDVVEHTKSRYGRIRKPVERY